MDQIAGALTVAHRQGVVHRDIKPDNILLDEGGNAYLSDFGIAKVLGAVVDQTQGDALTGSPAYVSPEQIQSGPITPLTDVYSLGVVLYELLTAVHPFPDEPLAALLVKHLNEPLPSALASRSSVAPRGSGRGLGRAHGRPPSREGVGGLRRGASDAVRIEHDPRARAVPGSSSAGAAYGGRGRR